MKTKPFGLAECILPRITTYCQRASLVGLMVFGITNAAQAQSIVGTIQFSGGALLDNADLAQATQFLQIFGAAGPGSDPEVLASTETGTYTSIPNGTPASFTPFVFSPPAASVIPLWTLTIGSTTYSFDATSVVVEYQSASFLDIGGTGVAHVTGMQDTSGTWSITDIGDSGLPVFTFGAATQVGSMSPIPEPSVTALLVMAGLPMARFLGRRR